MGLYFKVMKVSEVGRISRYKDHRTLLTTWPGSVQPYSRHAVERVRKQVFLLSVTTDQVRGLIAHISDDGIA
jgi:hypothetical protein